jgi:hypothetical protein
MRFVVCLLVALCPVVAWADDGNPSFNLVNRGAEPITEVYATPAGVPRWGQDRLARFLLPPGRTFPVRLPDDGTCVYDIRVVYASGRPEERRRLNTCEIAAVTFPGGRPTGSAPAASNQVTDDPSFRLVNRGRADVNEVYVSPIGNDHWGRDRLGDDTVSAGESAVIRMPRGDCAYDVRVVFADGEAVERRRLNLCTITDLRVP